MHCYYKATAEQFLTDVESSDAIFNELVDAYQHQYEGKLPPESELQSWRETPSVLAHILRLATVTRDQIVALEYGYPSYREQSNNRMDAVLYGKGIYRRNHAIVLELKQWEGCSIRCSKNNERCVQIWRNGEWEDRLHPSEQIRDYKAALEWFVQSAEHAAKHVEVYGYGYLYNCNPMPQEMHDVLFAQRYRDARRVAPIFSGDFAPALAKRIRERLPGGKGEEVYTTIESLRSEAYEKFEQLLRKYGLPTELPI